MGLEAFDTHIYSRLIAKYDECNYNYNNIQYPL